MYPILRKNSNTPLYHQLYEYIKTEILLGKVNKDYQLPSKRTMSTDLDVSVNTITRAYEMLLDEGYIYSKERSGYFTSDILYLKKSTEEVKLEKQKIKNYKWNFSINQVDIDHFPYSTYRRIGNEVLGYQFVKYFQKDQPFGMDKLKLQIKEYLRSNRGIDCNIDNILIGPGIINLLETIVYILPKDTVFAIENPGYIKFVNLLDRMDRKYRSINLDDKGMKVPVDPCDVAFVSPSHQFPTGVIMPVDRRSKLLSWADERDRYIIENDYDSEFKYYGSPISTLKSLDRSDRVIYLGNFSKSLSPSIRISYTVLPDRLLKVLQNIKSKFSVEVGLLDQLIVAQFMEDGYFLRHLNRMRRIYDEKRQLLISEIQKSSIDYIDNGAGINLILDLGEDIDENSLVDYIKSNGVAVAGMSNYYHKGSPTGCKLLLGYGSLSQEDIPKAWNDLLNLIQEFKDS